MSDKPSVMLSKGQRNALNQRFGPDDFECYYRDMMRGLYQYEGDLPENMPYGFIEATALFGSPGVAFKDVKGLGFCCFGANPVYVDIYGTPVQWLPTQVWGMGANQAQEAIGIFEQSDTPVFWNQQSYHDRIWPWLVLLSKAYNALKTNIVASQHPVIIAGTPSGRPGDNIASLMLESELDDGATFIPTVRAGDPLGLQAIDLGVQPMTDALQGTVDWCDTKIKAILGLDTGIEKASGIGAYDAKGTGGLATLSDSALELRKEWLEKVNERFGTSITVRKNTDIEQIIKGDDNGSDMESGEGDRAGEEDTEAEADRAS